MKKISKELELTEFVADVRADSEAFVDDPDVADVFDEEQRRGGLEPRAQLLGEEQPSISLSAVTGGDLDADSLDAETVGEEAAGGANPTPDQDIVEEIGRSYGITYSDDEPLGTGQKLAARDAHRWELDPASAEDFQTRRVHK